MTLPGHPSPERPAAPAPAPPGLALIKGGPGTGGSLEGHAPLELGRIAYEKHHAAVFHAWLDRAAPQRREALRERYVFLSVCTCAGGHLAQLQQREREQATAFVHELTEAVQWLAQGGRIGFAEEWFHGLEQLAGAFTDAQCLLEGRAAIDLALSTGVERFPRIAQALAVHGAWLDAMVGRRDEAAAAALRLVRTPYLLPNRRDLPRLYQKLMFVLSASHLLAEYRQVLWKGATSLYARGALRDSFVEQIVKTYRGAWRAVLRGEARVSHRLLFLVGNLACLADRVPLLKTLMLPHALRHLQTAGTWVLDRFAFLRQSPFVDPRRRQRSLAPLWHRLRLRLQRALSLQGWRAPRRVLVTRAMGGLGDLLMMTPGLRAMRRRWPGVEIDFAVPKGFHTLFDGFEGVRLLDINGETIDLSGYQRWVNLTDCPAGRREAQQFPNVRDNRIEIFARAMGIGKLRLKRLGGFQPAYQVREDEAAWARETLATLNPRGLPVIGVQPFAADTYRNWPHMPALVQRLAERALVLVFHHEATEGFDGPNIVKVVQPLRRSVALLAQCERLVVLDSSFLHFAAALGLPAVAVFGAISGRVRTKSYPTVRLVAPDKREFPCYPCWRHEHKPCHLTQGRESICLRSIGVDEVVDAFDQLPLAGPRRPAPWSRLKTWFLYGRE